MLETVSEMNTSPKRAWWSEWWGRCGRGVNPTVPLFVMLHLAVTLPLALILNFWVDESYSLYTSSGSLSEAFIRAIWFEQQAPGYFLLLDLWRMFGSDPGIARLLSVLCTTGTLLLAAHVSRHLFPGWSPAWLVGFLALNPALVWAAVEVRAYPMAILAATMVMLCFFATLLDDHAVRRSLIFLVLAGGLALYTQYYLGFLLAALGLGIVIAAPVRSVKRYAATMAGVAVVCLPIAFWLPDQLRALRGASADAFNMREAVGFWLHVISSALIPGYELLGRLVPSERYQAAVWALRLGLTVAVMALLIASRGLGRLLRESSVIIVWVALLASAACFAGLGFLTDTSLVSAHRHWSFLSVPGAAAYMSIAWATGRPKVMAAFLGLALAVNAVVLVDTYGTLAKEGDAKRVAAFIVAREQPAEPILVFPNELALPLRMYYSGVNTIVPVPREVSLEVYDPRNAAIKSEEEVVHLLDTIEENATAMWLVRCETTGYRGVSYGLMFLDAVVATRYSATVEERFFDRVTVQRLTPRIDE